MGTKRHDGTGDRHWKIYKCESCGGITLAMAKSDSAEVKTIYPSTVKENFEVEHLPDEVAADFTEALECYSIHCYNAFGAMCRRTVQSVFTDLGAKGKARVQTQLEDVKETAEIDDDTFDVLKLIIISGHDGAHPHLPKLSAERAGVLLELMKDVLYQLYVRKAKVREAINLRTQTITQSRPANEESQ